MEDDSPYNIAIARLSELAPISDERLVRAIRAALLRHKTPRAEISVALVDDVRITRLNEIHCNRPNSTDVLAFDLRDQTDTVSGTGGEIEGEIVVSVETAVREADARGHSAEAEVTLYTVHGILHLLGYDDAESPDARRMHELEDEILASLGLEAVYGREPRCG
ncbi:MAG: rRNA maturation RNase YbeY [Planctomycetes bacterium]|nr:rRNA maturation RNase YbeY [Planctomycetota bacterium]